MRSCASSCGWSASAKPRRDNRKNPCAGAWAFCAAVLVSPGFSCGTAFAEPAFMKRLTTAVAVHAALVLTLACDPSWDGDSSDGRSCQIACLNGPPCGANIEVRDAR